MRLLRPPARGFSLIEMVAAFLVFALGVGVLMSILANSMHSARQSKEYTMAALWAQSLLDTVGVGTQIEAGQSSGNFDDNYSWQMNIQEVDPSAIEPAPQAAVAAGNTNAPAPQQMSVGNAGVGGGMQQNQFELYQVDLTVLWGGSSGGQPRTAVFSTLRAINPNLNQNGLKPHFTGSSP